MVIVEGEGEDGRGRHSTGGGCRSNVRPMSKCSSSLQGRRSEGVVREGGRDIRSSLEYIVHIHCGGMHAFRSLLCICMHTTHRR